MIRCKFYALFCALSLSLTLLAVPGSVKAADAAQSETMAYADYQAKYQEFLSDARWADGASWGAISPRLSGYGATGCAAYCADFIAYVYGIPASLRAGTPFSDYATIQTGDVLHFYLPNGTEHWIVVVEKNEGTLLTAEGNYGGKVVVGDTYYSYADGILYHEGAACTAYEGYHYAIEASDTIDAGEVNAKRTARANEAKRRDETSPAGRLESLKQKWNNLR